MSRRVVLHDPAWSHRRPVSAALRGDRPVKATGTLTLFDPDSYEEIHEEPQAHREYLNSSVQAGKVPLLYFTIPHVLVAGPIDTAGLSLVDWTVPLPG